MARKRNPHETERRWRTLLTRLERSGHAEHPHPYQDLPLHRARAMVL